MFTVVLLVYILVVPIQVDLADHIGFRVGADGFEQSGWSLTLGDLNPEQPLTLARSIACAEGLRV